MKKKGWVCSPAKERPVCCPGIHELRVELMQSSGDTKTCVHFTVCLGQCVCLDWQGVRPELMNAAELLVQLQAFTAET